LNNRTTDLWTNYRPAAGWLPRLLASGGPEPRDARRQQAQAQALPAATSGLPDDTRHTTQALPAASCLAAGRQHHDRPRPRRTTSQLKLKFMGGLFHTPTPTHQTTRYPVCPPTKRQTPKRKEQRKRKWRKSKTKAFFEHLPHHHLGRPNPPRPPLAHLAPTSRFWMRHRSALPLHTLDIRLKPRISPPYPATSPLFSSPYPPPFCTSTGQRGTADWAS
jgi:hypothetical protein